MQVQAIVAQHFQEAIVGINNQPLKVGENSAHHVGVKYTAEFLFALPQGRLGLFAIADVIVHADHALGLALGITKQLAIGLDVADCAIGKHDSKFGVVTGFAACGGIE